MQFYYLEDGSSVGELNGRPYNFHSIVTPEQWLWFQDQLDQGLLEEIPRPPDPEPTPMDPALLENAWREEQMPIAKNNVTAIEYGEPGDAQAWKTYWLALRKWTADNPGFPDSTKRPQAPS